jgi:hypothetical protein
MVEGVYRLSSGGRVEEKTIPTPPVLYLDAELILEVAAFPEEVDDKRTALSMTEVIRRVHPGPPHAACERPAGAGSQTPVVAVSRA